MVVVADVEVVELDEYPWGQLRAGDGEGDFLERLSGASVAAPVADPPAMSTCSSTRRGDGVGAATRCCGEPMEPVVVLAWATDETGGEIDVECGDWK